MEVLTVTLIILIILSGFIVLFLVSNILMDYIWAVRYCAAHNDAVYSHLKTGRLIAENEKYWLHAHFPGRIRKDEIPFVETR